MKYTSDKARILSTLRTRKRGITALELSEKLNLTSPQAVYAAVSILRKEGHPIKSTSTGRPAKYVYATA